MTRLAELIMNKLYATAPEEMTDEEAIDLFNETMDEIRKKKPPEPIHVYCADGVLRCIPQKE